MKTVRLTTQFHKNDIMKKPYLFTGSITVCGITAIALGLLSSPLRADEKDHDKAKAAGAPDMAEMMKKMEALAAPGPEHQMLASLAGEWATEAKCFMAGPEAPPTVTKGTCKGKMILGGRFLQEEFEGDMMGKQFQGIGLLGYDKFNKRFVNLWMDSMGTGFFTSEGTCDESGKVLTLNGKMDDPMTGEKAKPMRLVTKILSPDKHVFEMHDVALGEKSKVMEITYVRKNGTSSTTLTTSK